MSFAESLFRGGFVAVLAAGLVAAAYAGMAGWAGIFGLLLGTALERLMPTSRS